MELPPLHVYAKRGYIGSLPVDYIAVINIGNSAATVEENIGACDRCAGLYQSEEAEGNETNY